MYEKHRKVEIGEKDGVRRLEATVAGKGQKAVERERNSVKE